MKRLLLSLMLLAGIIFAACEEEDTQPTHSCVTCTSTQNGQTNTHELCNNDGQAYIDGMLAGTYSYWIDQYTSLGYTCQ